MVGSTPLASVGGAKTGVSRPSLIVGETSTTSGGILAVGRIFSVGKISTFIPAPSAVTLETFEELMEALGELLEVVNSLSKAVGVASEVGKLAVVEVADSFDLTLVEVRNEKGLWELTRAVDEMSDVTILREDETSREE